MSVTRHLERPTRGSGGPGRTSPPIWPCSDWGLPCHALLPGARWALTPPFHPYLPVTGGLFSVALSVALRRPGVTWQSALWSSDFPRPRAEAAAATVRPTTRFHPQDSRPVYCGHLTRARTVHVGDRVTVPLGVTCASVDSALSRDRDTVLANFAGAVHARRAGSRQPSPPSSIPGNGRGSTPLPAGNSPRSTPIPSPTPSVPSGNVRLTPCSLSASYVQREHVPTGRDTRACVPHRPHGGGRLAARCLGRRSGCWSSGRQASGRWWTSVSAMGGCISASNSRIPPPRRRRGSSGGSCRTCAALRTIAGSASRPWSVWHRAWPRSGDCADTSASPRPRSSPGSSARVCRRPSATSPGCACVYVAAMLEARGLSIADVVYRLEYSSPQSFGRHLRTLTGLSASEFRRRVTFELALEQFHGELIAPFRAVLHAFHPLETQGQTVSGHGVWDRAGGDAAAQSVSSARRTSATTG